MCLLTECPIGHYLQLKETDSKCHLSNKETSNKSSKELNKEPCYLLPNREIVYHCVKECNYTSTRVDGDDVCYGNDNIMLITLLMVWSITACGIEKCTQCTIGRNGKDECTCCVKGYSPYHSHDSMSKCIPLKEKQTKLLEEMEEEEVIEREKADLFCE